MSVDIPINIFDELDIGPEAIEAGIYTIEQVKLHAVNMFNSKCKQLAFRRALINFYTKKYEVMLENGLFDETLTDVKEARQTIDDLSKNCTEWMFVTVNPRNDVTLEDFQIKIDKLLKKKWIDNYIYCIEQRSVEPNVYSGIHTHMLIHNSVNKKFSEFKREFVSTVNSICDAQNPSILNFRSVKDDSDLKKMISYIKGSKDVSKDKTYKSDQIANTIQFRLDNEIDPIYYSGPLTTELLTC